MTYFAKILRATSEQVKTSIEIYCRKSFCCFLFPGFTSWLHLDVFGVLCIPTDRKVRCGVDHLPIDEKLKGMGLFFKGLNTRGELQTERHITL